MAPATLGEDEQLIVNWTGEWTSLLRCLTDTQTHFLPHPLMNFIPGPPSSSRKCHYPSIHCGQRLESHTSLLLSPQRFQPLRHRALSTLSPETSLVSSSPLPHSYHSLGSQAAKLKNGPKTLTETSPKIYRWQVSTRKDAPCHLSVGKCKLKQQGETITYLAEWPKSGTLATPKAGEDVEQWERSFIASENA